MRRFKKLRLQINVPADYRYLAIQPWGETVIFKKEPVVFIEGSDEYWKMQMDEISMANHQNIVCLNYPKNWKNSVKKI